jgi:CspA family cold shock protein
MLSGKVRFYDREKRFGNIAPDEGTEDVFVHETALERAGVYDLSEGQDVWYETIRDALTGRLMVRVLEVPLPAGGEAPGRSRPDTDRLPFQPPKPSAKRDTPNRAKRTA